jgi:hypothetical protein
MSTPVCLTSMSIFKTGRSDRNRAMISHEPGVSLQDVLGGHGHSPGLGSIWSRGPSRWTELSNGFGRTNVLSFPTSSRTREPPAVETPSWAKLVHTGGADRGERVAKVVG